jgi:hypothetical protein
MTASDEAMAQLRIACAIASSAGEPLNPEVIRWADRVLRCPLWRSLRPEGSRDDDRQSSRAKRIW